MFGRTTSNIEHPNTTQTVFQPHTHLDGVEEDSCEQHASATHQQRRKDLRDERHHGLVGCPAVPVTVMNPTRAGDVVVDLKCNHVQVKRARLIKYSLAENSKKKSWPDPCSIQIKLIIHARIVQIFKSMYCDHVIVPAPHALELRSAVLCLHLFRCRP